MDLPLGLKAQGENSFGYRAGIATKADVTPLVTDLDAQYPRAGTTFADLKVQSRNCADSV